jgi:hypothetical protein
MPIEVWRKWFNGEVPLRMGYHLIDLVAPPGTYNPVSPAVRVPSVRLLVSLQVDGLVLSVAGESRRLRLVNALDDSVERHHVSATFAPKEGQHTLSVFDGEDALDEYVLTTPTPRITSRVRIPRIVLGAAYWPLSSRVARLLQTRAEAHSTGEYPDLPPFDFETLEGSDIAGAWEPFAPVNREN